MNIELALADVCGAWPALMPPNRMRISEGAAKSLKVARPGSAPALWNPLETPYMVEPLDTLASRVHSAVCFVGPAQTGKTLALGEGWMTHAVLNDPGDMLIVQMTQDKAREYSKQRVDRAIRASDDLRAMRTASSRDDNLHDKQFKNGMWLRIAWPTASNLSSTSYRYVFGTDYDRWDDNIDGEGDGFTLMGKRTTTFLSRGMVAVESSPGREITDPSWQPATPHEAPPVSGILGIYNRSDRRRFYWKCPHCAEWMQSEPGLGLFHLPSDDELLEGIRDLDIDKFARQYARAICPNNACVIKPAEREAMNRGGLWLPDGVSIDAQDRRSGAPRTSSIAGFWLGGAAATYVSWRAMIQKHLQALLDYELTGDELALQTTANTDQGVPYMSRALAEAKRSAEAGSKHEADLQRYVVPDRARYIVQSVDVQGGRNARFVVQVHAVGPHQEQWLLDRRAITRSLREGTDGDQAPIDPASHPEDWDVLTPLLTATYRTSREDLELRVKMTLVDSGGEDGVTDNAYAWYRRVRKLGLHQKVRLIKGYSGKVDWHIKETEVGGANNKKGDVPLWLLEPNKFKDMVWAGMNRRTPGPGYYHWPVPKGPLNPDGWLLPAFFEELRAESRNDKGVWEQHKKRNEAFDLCYMIRAGCRMLGADKREFWNSPPAWALPLWEGNSEIVAREVRQVEQEAVVSAPPAPVARTARAVRPRRSQRSSYLG